MWDLLLDTFVHKSAQKSLYGVSDNEECCGIVGHKEVLLDCGSWLVTVTAESELSLVQSLPLSHLRSHGSVTIDLRAFTNPSESNK